jgi:hypothetical protein
MDLLQKDIMALNVTKLDIFAGEFLITKKNYRAFS